MFARHFPFILDSSSRGYRAAPHTATSTTGRRIAAALVAVALVLLIGSCAHGKDAAAQKAPFSIAVFVPGSTTGNPMFEMMVSGVHRAADKHANVTVHVVEGGQNESDWPVKLSTLAQSGRYNLIVTTGSPLPEICAGIVAQYPAQKFLVLDSYLKGNTNLYTVLYNRREQSFLLGYFGGLMLTQDSSIFKAGKSPGKVGLLVANKDPMTDQVVRKGFELGLRTVNPSIVLDVRVLGNSYDAAKAGQIAGEMIDSGARLILPIVGAADSGVIATAKEKVSHLLWFDTPGYKNAPGIVLGSALVRQDQAAYEKTSLAIEGKLEYGSAIILDARAGFVGFDDTDPLYRKYVPEKIRNEESHMIERMKSGSFRLLMPTNLNPPKEATN